MSINDEGFLSDEIERWRQERRTWFGPQFRVAYEISRLGQRFLPLTGKFRPTPQNMFFCAFFIRCLQSMQGAIIVAERGLITEARTLIRCTIETLFYMEATRRDAEFVKRFGQEHVKRMTKMAADHIAVDPSFISDSDLQNLQAALKEMTDSGIEGMGLQIIEAAKAADLLWMYRTYYAELSTNGAHPTFVSIGPIWNRLGPTDEPTGVGWGPSNYDTDALPEQLVQIAGIGYQVLTHANAHFRAKGLGDEVERIGKHILELTKRIQAKAETKPEAPPNADSKV